MSDLFDDPDWPLALEALREANGYDVQSIHVAPDVMAKLEAIPRGSATRTDGMPWTFGVAILSDRYLAPGNGFAILRNGQVRRLFGRRSTSASPPAPCSTCKGSGTVDDLGEMNFPNFVPCPSCAGRDRSEER